MSSVPAPGQIAPDFTLPTDADASVTLSALKGGPVVVYFYPKDDTPGCTIEAKDFACLTGEFAKARARVIGISPDSAKSHAKFRKKHELGDLILASDEEKSAASAFGVWVEKSIYGKKYMGVERSTFLIDAEGKVVKAWDKVKVAGHAEDVLAEVRALSA